MNMHMTQLQSDAETMTGWRRHLHRNAAAARNVAPQNRAVVTVGAFLAGEAGNVIPQTASLRLSIRTSTPDTRAPVPGKIRVIAATQAESHGVTHEIREGIPGAVPANDADLTARCAHIAAAALGKDHVETSGPTFMGSEDFAFFAQKRPAVDCIIGNGDTPMVHHPLYDFDDRNLPMGAVCWVAIAEASLR